MGILELYGPAAVVLLFLALLVLETASPLRKRTRPRPQRYAVNLCLTGVAFLAGSFIVRRIALGLAVKVEAARFGLLYMLGLSPALSFAAGFLLMDLTFYYWHRMNHTIMPLWRLHNVHHVDPDLDVTTSFRFHVAEILLSLAFRAAQVALIGVSPLVYAAYELVFTAETAFHHSNLRIPVGVERWVGKVLVTPRMHGIHHSAVKDETNSNYSVVFRWWDLLHGSLRLDIQQSEIVIGVPAYLRPGEGGVLSLMAMPFVRQREYWRFDDGRLSLTRAASQGRDKKLIME